MSRLKARLAADPFDREMHKHLAVAVRALAKAEEVCGKASRSLRGPSSKYGGQFAGRALDNLKRIRQIKAMAGSIGFSVPNRDFSDTDLMSEDALAERARVGREARAESKQAELRAAAGGED